MNLMISRAHQRRHPEHHHPRRGPQRALALQQRARREHGASRALVGMDGLRELVKLDRDGPELRDKVRELKERAVLFLEAMLRRRRLLRRRRAGATSSTPASTPRPTTTASRARPTAAWPPAPSCERAADYLAPVCHHFGDNHLPEGYGDARRAGRPRPQALRPHRRLHAVRRRQGALHRRARPRGQRQRAPGADRRAAREGPASSPRCEWAADGIVVVTLFLPAGERVAEFAALELAKAMNLQDPEVINKQVMHPAEGTLVEVKGRLDVAVDPATLVIPPRARGAQRRGDQGLRREARPQGGGRHGGRGRALRGHARDHRHQARRPREVGRGCEYLGTSVPVEKVLDAAIEHAAQAVLISTIITHGDIHRQNMEKLADLAVEKGVRDKLLLIAGGTQVTDELARSWGMDAGFGRGTKGIDVASFIVKTMRERGPVMSAAGRAAAPSTPWSPRSAPPPPWCRRSPACASYPASDAAAAGAGRRRHVGGRRRRHGRRGRGASGPGSSRPGRSRPRLTLATSSAAGGLRMTVHGLTQRMTAMAAREAALGAGAVVDLPDRRPPARPRPARASTRRAPTSSCSPAAWRAATCDTVLANARAPLRARGAAHRRLRRQLGRGRRRCASCSSGPASACASRPTSTRPSTSSTSCRRGPSSTTPSRSTSRTRPAWSASARS